MPNHRNSEKIAQPRALAKSAVLSRGKRAKLARQAIDSPDDFHLFSRNEVAAQAPAPQQEPSVHVMVSMSALREKLIAELTARCAQFGIDATASEILGAGLLLLAEKTETALEVAMLQSLRADRTFTPRKTRRK
jgi:methylmalonyl-CoA mutase cobalamin-binding subunit